MHILIIEDEEQLCRSMAEGLRMDGYETDTCFDGEEGLELCMTENYDLILLDLNLPGIDGLDILRQFRTFNTNTPVLILSARVQIQDKVEGLDLGANDYLTKPFGTAELLARIRTALRHSQRAANENSKYEVGGLLIDFERRLVKVNDQDVHLTQIEYKLVSLLAHNAGRVLTYETIISKIWGPFADSDNQILRVNMAHIRRKLEENPAEPKYIFTEIGVGYRMREE